MKKFLLSMVINEADGPTFVTSAEEGRSVVDAFKRFRQINYDASRGGQPGARVFERYARAVLINAWPVTDKQAEEFE